MSAIAYRPFSPRNHEEMIDLQAKAYATPRSQVLSPYHNDEVEALGAFEDNHLISALEIISFKLRLWDRVWPAGGVASVATHVEHRRRGHVSNLTRLALERMREKGMAVSALYPFSYAFYRRLGWEHSGDLLHFTVPLRDLPTPPDSATPGACRFERLAMDESGGIDPGIPAQVYEASVAPYNCPNARDHEWDALARKLQQRIAGGTNIYAYAGFRGDKPVFYAIYTIGSGESSMLRVMDSAASDARAWKDLLGLLSLHSTDAEKLDIYTPVDAPLRLILPEANKAYLQPSAMLRVVDVERLLNGLGPTEHEGIPYDPPGCDSFSLRVIDPVCPWNDAVFQVSMCGGAVQAAKCGTGREPSKPSVSMDIAAFSQVTSGYTTPLQIMALGKMEATDRAAVDALQRIFPGRVTFNSDFY